MNIIIHTTTEGYCGYNGAPPCELATTGGDLTPVFIFLGAGALLFGAGLFARWVDRIKNR